MNFKLLICIIIFCLDKLNVDSAILKVSKENASNICSSQDCIETAALISTSMDDTVDPCDDFYDYACGNWMKEHFVPPKSLYYYSHFYKLSIEIGDLLDYKFNKGYQPDEPAVLKRIHNFYNTCIDFDSRNKAGVDDLKELIQSIGGWPIVDSNWNPDKFHWEDTYAKVNHLFPMSFPFSLSVIPDYTNQKQNILMFKSQFSNLVHAGSLKVNGIVKQDDPIEIMPKFDIFNGFYDWQYNRSQTVMRSKINKTEWYIFSKQMDHLALKLKRISTTTVYQGTIEEYIMKNYDKHMWSIDKLKKTIPNINWDKLFTGLFGKANITQKVFVMDTHFANSINDFIKQVDKRMLAHYFALNTVMNLAVYTTKENYNLFSFTPIKQMCIQYAIQLHPNLLSKLYLNHVNFTEAKRTQIQDLVKLIKSSFEQLLDANTWMDPVTKKIAKEKLLAIQANVGAPDIVFDEKLFDEYNAEFGDLNDNHFLNMVKSLRIRNKKVFYSLDHPQNTSNWPAGLDYAPIVNAFYHPNYNQIYLPAGIEQVPFYGLNRPISVNLGTLGVIIGHELTHGFDNQGSKYDLHGQYQNWWTKETLEKFNTKNQCFVEQYSKFNVTEANQFIDGRLTLGENIADNGGMREAFNALRNYKKQFGSIDKLPGDLSQLSDEKIFFLSFANQWCENKDKLTSTLLLTDVHSPAHARVVLSLANFDEFAKTFNCPINSRMNPKDKCITW